MGFFEANLWKHSIFKGAASMLSSPQLIQKCIYVSESGIISLESLALATGYCSSVKALKAWMVVQAAKKGLQGCDEQVLPISDRSYIPLDPNSILNATERKNLASLDEIASTKYIEAFTRVSEENKKNANHRLLVTMGTLLGIATLIVVIFKMIKK